MRVKFLKNVSYVATGAIVAQAIALGVSPILTRIYSADEIGLMGGFAAIVSICGTVATGRYDLAIMLPNGRRDAQTLLVLSCFISFVVGCLLTLPVAYSDHIAFTLGIPDLQRYLGLIGPSVALLGLANAIEQWASREQAFRLTAIAAVLSSILSAAVMIFGGALELGAGMLLLGIGAGYLGRSVVVVAGLSMCSPRKIVALKYRKLIKDIRCVAYSYADFPRYRATQDFINAVSQNIPALLLGALFGPTYVALFWLAHRALSAPSLIVARAVRRVLYQQASEQDRDGRGIFELTLKLTIGMFLLGSGPYLLVVLFGPDLFALVFGEDWRGGGLYARWLAIWMMAGFANTPAVVVIPLLNLQKEFLIYEIISVASRVSALVVTATLTQSDLLGVAALCVSAATMNITLVIFVLRRCYVRESEKVAF